MLDTFQRTFRVDRDPPADSLDRAVRERDAALLRQWRTVPFAELCVRLGVKRRSLIDRLARFGIELRVRARKCPLEMRDAATAARIEENIKVYRRRARRGLDLFVEA